MGDAKLNFSSWTFCHTINLTHCFHALLLFSLACAPSSAQSSTESPNNEYPSFAMASVITICAFFVVGTVVQFIRHCMLDPANSAATAAAANQRSPGRRGLDPSLIELFPILAYSAVKQIKIGRETLECAVCLSEFEDSDALRLLPKCNHVFHPECIDEWLASCVTCPVCRAIVTPVFPEISEPQPIQRSQESPEPVQANGSQNHQVSIAVDEENPPSRCEISKKFLRSHTTGHSLENVARYTLRLPEETRRQLVRSGRLKRTVSFNVVLEGSPRKGYRNGSIGGGGSSSRRGWVFSMTPPFVSRGRSDKCCKADDEGDSSVNGRTTLFGYVKVPLCWFGVKVDGEGGPSVPRPAV